MWIASIAFNWYELSTKDLAFSITPIFGKLFNCNELR